MVAAKKDKKHRGSRRDASGEVDEPSSSRHRSRHTEVRRQKSRRSRRVPSSDEEDEESDASSVSSSGESSGSASGSDSGSSGGSSASERPKKQYRVVVNRKAKHEDRRDREKAEKREKSPGRKDEPAPAPAAPPAGPSAARALDEEATVQASEVLAATGLDAKPAQAAASASSARSRTLEHRGGNGGGAGDYGAAYRELYEQLCGRMVHRIMQIVYRMHSQAKTEKRFKYQLAEIQRWNQDQIHRITRLFVRSHKDIIRVFRFAYAADVLVMSVVVQRDENSADVEIECPRFSDFVHRCFVETARNLFDHTDILDPRLSASEKFQVRDALHGSVSRAIATALRMMVPIHKIAPVRPEDEEQYDAIEETGSGTEIGLGGAPWADSGSEGAPDSDDDELVQSGEDDDEDDEKAFKGKKGPPKRRVPAKASKKPASDDDEESDEDESDEDDDEEDESDDDEEDESDDGSSDEEESDSDDEESDDAPPPRRRR